MTKAERRAAIERIRHDNESGFGPPARVAVQQMLEPALPSPWMYVYELTQNALDAGAQRVCWKTDGDGVLFQHDGHRKLDESHVRGIASLGASTKGLAAVGFMGIGFKSVFARFREARVSGSGWRFRFTVPVRSGELGSAVPVWFATLCPHWDDTAPLPEAGYSTAFHLRRPAARNSPIAEDLRKLVSLEDPTPLAVLALRGLAQVRVEDDAWELSYDDGIVALRRSGRDIARRWKVFVSRYRPSDAAMRQFLEVRQKPQDQIDDQGQRIERAAVALLPLDEDRLPQPAKEGRVYSTLPTQAQNPFGFHLQADWLVEIHRQHIREVDGNPWQEDIVRRVPDLVHQLLVWLASEPDAVRSRGYRALCDPAADDGPLAEPLRALKHDFVTTLADASVVPVHGVGPRRFHTPEQVARLPFAFRETFGSQWRPDLLFGLDLMDETFLGRPGASFARWLGWGREADVGEVVWAETLPRWWQALPQDDQAKALFALWRGVGESGWNQAPVVPTEAGGWKHASATVWLNEEPPTERESGGSVVLAALGGYLPAADERLPPRLRRDVAREHSDGARWLKRHHQQQELSTVVREACESDDDAAGLPLVPLLQWALHRGDKRQDLVPLVLTEKGARRPNNALLANPLVGGGRGRRLLFPKLPALVADYAQIEDHDAVVLFLERLGIHGGCVLNNRETWVSQDRPQEVARQIGLDVGEVKPANRDGYSVVDPSFPFAVENVPPEALQDWLTREHAALRRKGRRKALRSYYYDASPNEGRTSAAWVRALQKHPWLLCTDGQRRRPAEVLIEADFDFEDAPVADIDPELAVRLEAEGVHFGQAVPKSPVMRRLEARGSTDLADKELADLLDEARRHLETGESTKEELLGALGAVRVSGVPLVSRVVQRAGSGSKLRSDLGWVIALSDVDPALADAIKNLPLDMPRTTTGRQALDFLRDVWNRRPSSVEDLRGRLAAAYRYVLEDVGSGLLPADDWREARAHAQLYGGRRWHLVGPTLAVDDVKSPLIHQFMPTQRVAVTSTHLGETSDQVRRVAKSLEIGLLSDDVSVEQGSRMASPPWADQLLRLLDTLAQLEDRHPLRHVEFLTALHLRVSGHRHAIHAYVKDATLMLAGDPRALGVEATGQLVEHFQLGQRGNEIPWLTGALFSLGDEDEFVRSLRVLADGLGVDPAEPRSNVNGEAFRQPARTLEPGVSAQSPPEETLDPEVTIEVKEEAHSVSPGASSSRPNTPTFSGPAGPTHQAQPDRDPTQNAQPVQPPTRSSRAADHFGILVARRGSKGSSARDTSADRNVFRDDHAARQAVVQYETLCGRRAKAMADDQPGFDVLSVDDSTGQERRIEVKGVKGIFEGDSSVVLTARQAHDAVQNAEHGVDYWLYVVDSTETNQPRVFPLPWVKRPALLRYGFYAHGWADAAERPAAVTTEGLKDLPSRKQEE